jgi:hypothetical protein
MDEAELPGREPVAHDLSALDGSNFLQQIPALLARLRMRQPALAFALNLSEASLRALGRVVANGIDGLPGGYARLAETLDLAWLQQVTAYVGETIVRNRDGRWRLELEGGGHALLVDFKVEARAGSPPRRKAVDISEHVLVAILEGGSLADWYLAEVLES